MFFSINSSDTNESNEKTTHLLFIHVMGTFDDPKVTICRKIVDDLKEKSIPCPAFKFKIEFETPFLQHRDELIKDNPKFLKFMSSPIIYFQKGNKIELIGSLDEFLKYLIENYGYYDTHNKNNFDELTKQNLRNFMSLSGNIYCFIQFSINHKIFDPVVIELFYKQYPKTCQNFISLCRGYINSNNENLTYQNTTVNRIVKNGYIQAGNLNDVKSFVSKSIYNGEFPDEGYNVTHSYPGIVGMVKKGNRRHSNECQFYITLTSLKSFDNLFVAFGRVVQGYDSIKEIESVDTYLQRPINKIKINKCGEYII